MKPTTTISFPTGEYVLMPVDPSNESCDVLKQHADGYLSNIGTYRAMLAAVPDQLPGVVEHSGEPVAVISGPLTRIKSNEAYRQLLRDGRLELFTHPAPSQPAHSSFPERDMTKPAEQQGMFHKFDVRRTDGSDAPGGKHHGCRYFVLDLDHDANAPAAMAAYGLSCAATHPALSAEILQEFPASQPSAESLVAAALEAAAQVPRKYALELDAGFFGRRFPEEATAICNASTNMADRIRALDKQKIIDGAKNGTR